MTKKVITFGTYDLFHIGHVNIIERAKELGDELYVGVSSDALNFKKKHVYPMYSEDDRMKIIGSMGCVDHVFLEESLELKRHYIEEVGADILVMGDDWEGRFDFCKDLCEVVYLTRTPDISTTLIKKKIKC